jgi:alkylation response protein AidB-like acyl-CoA dehydrogenase
MDFKLNDDQQAIADLAQQIFGDQATNEKQREVEQGDGPRFDRALWESLGEAGLLGIAISEDHGGAGLGFLEAAAILEQVGRSTAPVPFLETVVLGAMPLGQFGSDALQKQWLPGVAQGEVILTSAIAEELPTPATKSGTGWTLEGKRMFVPAGAIADAVLVPAKTDAGTTVFVVETKAPGVRVEPLATTSGQPEAALVLDGVSVTPDQIVGDEGKGSRILEWTRTHATSALCMVTLGACQSALDLTSEYIKTRKQFDQPIALFQSVGHRAADAYIDNEAVRLTAWQAAWRLSAGLDASKQVATAKFFAAESGKRVVHAAQHLHGGIGVDREYPLHRFFLYARHLELTLGGGTEHLLKLGKLIAAE